MSKNRPGTAAGGFTLLELLVALAVAAVLLGWAVPNLRTFLQNNRLASATNEFQTAIQRARTEAVKRGATVILCRTGAPHADPPGCRQNTPDGEANAEREWTHGWLMYALPAGETVERDYNAATDDLIAVGNGAPGGVEVLSDSDGNKWLTFAGDGSVNENAAPRYALCDDRGESEGREILVRLNGRVSVGDAADCTP